MSERFKERVNGERFLGLIISFIRQHEYEIKQNILLFSLNPTCLSYLNAVLKGETTLPPRFNKEDAYELELFMSELKCLKLEPNSPQILEKHKVIDLSIFENLRILEIEYCKPSLISNLSALSKNLIKMTVRSSIVDLSELLSFDDDPTSQLDEPPPLFQSSPPAIVSPPGSPLTSPSSSSPSYNSPLLAPKSPSMRLPPRCWSNLRVLNCAFNYVPRIDTSVAQLIRVEKMDLSHNLITKVENMQYCMYLSELDLSFNRLENLERVNETLGNIKILNLRNNLLTTVEGLHKLYALESLDLSCNMLKDLKSVEKLGVLPLLNVLSLAENPLTVLADYRTEILSLFDHPVILDGTLAEEELAIGASSRNFEGTTTTSAAAAATKKKKIPKKRVAAIEEAAVKETEQIDEEEADKDRDEILKMRKEMGEKWLLILNEVPASPPSATTTPIINPPATISPSKGSRFSTITKTNRKSMPPLALSPLDPQSDPNSNPAPMYNNTTSIEADIPIVNNVDNAHTKPETVKEEVKAPNDIPSAKHATVDTPISSPLLTATTAEPALAFTASVPADNSTSNATVPTNNAHSSATSSPHLTSTTSPTLTAAQTPHATSTPATPASTAPVPVSSARSSSLLLSPAMSAKKVPVDNEDEDEEPTESQEAFHVQREDSSGIVERFLEIKRDSILESDVDTGAQVVNFDMKNLHDVRDVSKGEQEAVELQMRVWTSGGGDPGLRILTYTYIMADKQQKELLILTLKPLISKKHVKCVNCSEVFESHEIQESKCIKCGSAFLIEYAPTTALTSSAETLPTPAPSIMGSSLPRESSLSRFLPSSKTEDINALVYDDEAYQATVKGDLHFQTFLKLDIFAGNEEYFVYMFKTTYIKFNTNVDSESTIYMLLSSKTIYLMKRDRPADEYSVVFKQPLSRLKRVVVGLFYQFFRLEIDTNAVPSAAPNVTSFVFLPRAHGRAHKFIETLMATACFDTFDPPELLHTLKETLYNLNVCLMVPAQDVQLYVMLHYKSKYHKGSIPRSLVFSRDRLYLCTENYAKWPSCTGAVGTAQFEGTEDEPTKIEVKRRTPLGGFKTATQYQVQFSRDMRDISNIHVHGSSEVTIYFEDEEGLKENKNKPREWELVTSHPAEQQRVVKILSVLWKDLYRINLPITKS